MIDKIKSALAKAGVSEYKINIRESETAELFFVKKRLDLRRANKGTNYRVAVFNSFTKDEISLKGSADIIVFPGMSEDEITEKAKAAYMAASFSHNPAYEFSGPFKDEVIKEMPTLEEGVKVMSAALFAADNREDAFLNSAELFVEHKKLRIITSKGTDITFNKFSVNGEFVAQCKEPQDVETYMDFAYDGLEAAALTELVSKTLDTTVARAAATEAPKGGVYRVMISGRYVKNIFEFFLERADASMIYPKYSSVKVGDSLQGKAVKGDKLNITLKASNPYSLEGIPMKDRVFMEDGVLKTLQGTERFSYYLGIEPTGSYGSSEDNDGGFTVAPGKKSLAELKSKPYLNVVNFSDFQVDPMNGHFGGEIRLAFLYDGEKEIPVTGGSISGNMFEVVDNLTLSAELQKELRYEGPECICFEGINVGGK